MIAKAAGLPQLHTFDPMLVRSRTTGSSIAAMPAFGAIIIQAAGPPQQHGLTRSDGCTGYRITAATRSGEF